MKRTILEIQNLTKYYGKIRGVENISLKLEEGEIFGFIGPNGAMIIDTPGMRELGMWEVSEGLDKTFQDVEQYLGKCKFSDCTHTNEPGCKILEAIENGELSEDRFNSYIKLQNEARYNNDSESYLKEKKEKFKAIAKYNKKK